MGMRKTGLAFGLAAVCAVWLVACGGGGGSAGSAASDSSSSSSVSNGLFVMNENPLDMLQESHNGQDH